MSGLINMMKRDSFFSKALGLPTQKSPASIEESKRLTSLKSRGGTLLTGGRGIEDDEDIVKKKTLLGA